MLIENFKVGGLAKFGLDYKSLKDECPRLIYCSVTGFGQDGPYAKRAGYDLMAQGMGGVMDLTGMPDGEPTRIGIPMSDIFTGCYSVVGILAALARARPHRQGRLCRHRAGRFHRRRAVEPGAELSRLRQGAQAHRQRARQHRAVPGVPDRRRLRHRRHRQRRAICQILQRARRARTGPEPGLPEQCRPPHAPRGADRQAVGADQQDASATTCWPSSRRRACRPARSTTSSRCSRTRR